MIKTVQYLANHKSLKGKWTPLAWVELFLCNPIQQQWLQWICSAQYLLLLARTRSSSNSMNILKTSRTFNNNVKPWQIMTDYDRFWQIMTDNDRLWQILTDYNRLWHIMTYDNRSWLLMVYFGQTTWKNKNKQRKMAFWTKQTKLTKVEWIFEINKQNKAKPKESLN